MLTEQTNWRQLVARRGGEAKHTVAHQKTPIFLVIDDHDAVLQCLVPILRVSYPEAFLLAAQDCKTARRQIEQYQPDLVILDLDLPEELGKMPRCEAGIRLLRTVMESHPASNILVLGTSVRPLVRLKSDIYCYSAGFTAADKTQPVPKLLKMIELSMRKSIHLPPDIRSRPDFKPQWLTLLTLKFQDGLSDRAIAQQMQVSTRTLRSYWLHIQDALEVYDDPNLDLRVQIEHAARRAGLID
ncbi:MAG: response regulator transcription factor [Cyanobacteria bacterium P01_G01_bin.38]